MKKALSAVLLLSGLLLYGCGMGGGTTASSNGGNSTSTPGGGTQPQLGSPQVFTLNLVDAGSIKAARATTFENLTPDRAYTDVRVVMRLYSSVTTTHPECLWDYDSEGYPINPHDCHDVGVTKYTEVYKDIQDVHTSSATVSVSMPAADGYTIDVITSEGTAPRNILKYGQAKNVNVGGSNPTSGIVGISDVGAPLNMQVADSILSSTSTHTVSFDVTVNNGLPFAPAYSVSMTIDGNTLNKDCSSNTCTFDVPQSTTAQTVSVQGTFTLNGAFLKQGESGWTRLFPSLPGESVTYNLSPLVSVQVL